MTNDIANGTGIFVSAPAAGGTPAALGTNVRMHYAGSETYVVFNDNYDRATSTCEIRAANAGQTVSSVVVSLADADFYIAGTRDKLVYTWKYIAGDMTGLWVTTIPYF